MNMADAIMMAEDRGPNTVVSLINCSHVGGSEHLACPVAATSMQKSAATLPIMAWPCWVDIIATIFHRIEQDVRVLH